MKKQTLTFNEWAEKLRAGCKIRFSVKRGKEFKEWFEFCNPNTVLLIQNDGVKITIKL